MAKITQHVSDKTSDSRVPHFPHHPHHSPDKPTEVEFPRWNQCPRPQPHAVKRSQCFGVQGAREAVSPLEISISLAATGAGASAHQWSGTELAFSFRIQGQPPWLLLFPQIPHPSQAGFIVSKFVACAMFMSEGPVPLNQPGPEHQTPNPRPATFPMPSQSREGRPPPSPLQIPGSKDC